jgi:hypothetical protein
MVDRRLGKKIIATKVREAHPKKRTWQVLLNFNIKVIYLNYL